MRVLNRVEVAWQWRKKLPIGARAGGAFTGKAQSAPNKRSSQNKEYCPGFISNNQPLPATSIAQFN